MSVDVFVIGGSKFPCRSCKEKDKFLTSRGIPDMDTCHYAINLIRFFRYRNEVDVHCAFVRSMLGESVINILLSTGAFVKVSEEKKIVTANVKTLEDGKIIFKKGNKKIEVVSVILKRIPATEV